MPFWHNTGAFQPNDIAVVAICSVAILTDLSRHRVPNALTFGGMGLGLLFSLGQAGPLFALGGIALAFATLFPGWIFGGGVRAGDVKLMMAVGAFYGPEMAFRSSIAVYALAIPFSLVVLVVKGKLGNAVVAARALVTPLPGVPESERVVVPFVPVVAAGILLARTTGVLAW
ncbi:MAG TPA: prepilin peptidase [Myxococcales bacterium]|jgi:prepilin peptidase CpaA|nr:prepilin peptidase [Myxococcales bacterium]